jgi:hypothetical protein
MLVRQGLAIGVIAATWMALACSENPPRDINYGSDVGWDFTPPDVGAREDVQVDVQVEESGSSVDGSVDDAAPDASPDAALSDLDASTGGSK